MKVKGTHHIFIVSEKRHFNSKTIRNLKTGDNSRVSTDQEILQEAKTF